MSNDWRKMLPMSIQSPGVVGTAIGITFSLKWFDPDSTEPYAASEKFAEYVVDAVNHYNPLNRKTEKNSSIDSIPTGKSQDFYDGVRSTCRLIQDEAFRLQELADEYSTATRTERFHGMRIYPNQAAQYAADFRERADALFLIVDYVRKEIS